MARNYNFQTFRGDTFKFELVVHGLGESEFDDVEFTVRGKYVDNFAIVYKKLNDGVTYSGGKYTVECVPSDTQNVVPGTYVYDVQVTSGGDVYTVLYGKITFMEDVTRSA